MKQPRGPAFEHALEQLGDDPDALTAVMAAECKRLRVHPVLFEGRLPHDVMQEESLVCPHDPSSAAQPA